MRTSSGFAAVREAIGAEVALMVDANQALGRGNRDKSL